MRNSISLASGTANVALTIGLAVIMAVLGSCVASARVEEQYVDASNDVSLYYRVAGNLSSGHVLLAVSGGPGLSSHYMVDLERIAGDELAVVTYDQRGTGRSSSPRPAVSGNFSLDRYVGDLETIREALGVNRTFLLGHSFGGVVAMKYAAVYPEHVSSLILVGSGEPTWDGYEGVIEALEDRHERLVQQGFARDDLPTDSPETMIENTREYFADPAFADEFARMAGPDQTLNTVTYRQTMSMMRGYDLRSELQTFTGSILVIAGSAELNADTAEGAFRAAMPNAHLQFMLLDNCGHFWHECPEPFYEALTLFLELGTSNG